MPKGKISGKVLDQNRNPINEAEVKVFKREESIKKPRKDMTITGKSSPIGTAITSEKGLYEADVTLEDSLEVVIVKAYAFDTESEDGEAEVSEHGSSKVDLRVPVAIKVTSHRMKENQETRLETQFTEGEVVILRAEINIRGRVVDDPERLQHYGYNWKVESGSLVEQRGHQSLPEVHWDTTGLRGVHTATVIVSGGSSGSSSPSEITVLPRALQRVDNVPVTMRRTAAEPTEDLALWVVIRRSAEAISFEKYSQSMDMLLCGRDAELNKLRDGIGYLPYSDLYAYKLLKAATEAFLMVNCGVAITKEFSKDELDYVMRRVGVGAISLDEFWDKYLRLLNGGPDRVIPYLALIREKLSDVRLVRTLFQHTDIPDECYGILQSKLTNPCLFELIWSYWHEEGMLVQTLHAITTRFQNVQGPGELDPLRMLEIDPLRPLNNLIWGYLQDEQYRLGVLRRAYEYDHHYGITLYGKAVPQLHTADSRSKFLEAFHNLLYLCAIFFKEDDDTTVIADGFPVLNALKEVHFLLAEGAHNQFGDMPSTARQEMMLQQWILARPEFREFLPTRIMVAYPEPWMDRVDAMKTLQGWTDVSVMHFHNLAAFGEQMLLSIRFGAWSTVNDPAQASNWARFWRPEIQGYIHAYRAATGIELTAEVTDERQAALRVTAPGILLRERLGLQRAQPRPVLGSAPRVTATLPPARLRGRER